MRWLDRHEGNLPHQAPELIGRSEICARVARAIGQSRLVTLHGPGGMGKTSIALHVADALRQDFPDGVWLVQLSALDNSAVVPSAVIEAFALADVSARPERDVLTEYLHQRTLLLVLDTCEHLQPAIADVARTLLDAAPGVRILATSRVPLDLEAEHLITIEPMRTEGTAGAGQRGGERPWNCSSHEPAKPGCTWTRPPCLRPRRCAGASTASRWRWSSLRPACPTCRSRNSWPRLDMAGR
ncbi:NB-ARC domain-containing protein [Nonomuraea thailandensis]